MADEKATNQNQENTEEKGKAATAGASGNYQGQQQKPEAGRTPQPIESTGQGGGIQGTGQQQPNPGGFTGGQGNLRDENRRDDKTKQSDQGKPTE
ncbi:MAG TPA: hypothetical protein VLL54_11375 [Pyrinomonadaceae bacterium]|nr:hypothetical protein [Pyrinomonadaceae bacterium]